jgi:hypothetical protein
MLGLMITILVIEEGYAENLYENYYLYLKHYPSNREITMSEQIQGVTHDENNWFFTQRVALWKIPVILDLDVNYTCSDSRIQCKSINDVPELSEYDHFGDLSYYWYIDEGYLFIPVEDHEPPQQNGVIAVFKASDLSFVDAKYVDYDLQGKSAPWCAVIPDIPGNYNRETLYLYSSKFSGVGGFLQYKINMSRLRDEDQLDMTYKGISPIFDESGDPSYTLDYIQGGVFSWSGDLLYMSNGDCWEECDCGLHVFENRNGGFWLVKRSSQNDYPFVYKYDPDSVFCEEEPEGITIWDLDDKGAPNIRGQLHALMFRDEVDQDDFYFKHYTYKIYVNGSYTGNQEYGKPWEPFNTINEANDYAWNGSQIKIVKGNYPESVTFYKRMQVIADGGTVVIGE